MKCRQRAVHRCGAVAYAEVGRRSRMDVFVPGDPLGEEVALADDAPAHGEENIEYEEDCEDPPNSIATDSHPPWVLEICLGQTSRESLPRFPQIVK